MPATEEVKKEGLEVNEKKELEESILRTYFNEYKRKVHMPLILSWNHNNLPLDFPIPCRSSAMLKKSSA